MGGREGGKEGGVREGGTKEGSEETKREGKWILKLRGEAGGMNGGERDVGSVGLTERERGRERRRERGRKGRRCERGIWRQRRDGVIKRAYLRTDGGRAN